MKYTLPDIIIHADWSKDIRKRWAAKGMLSEEGGYTAEVPFQVDNMLQFLREIRSNANPDKIIMAGFDFPIGLPVKYAERAGIKDFPSVLPKLGKGEWEEFYRVAEKAEEISLRRPFYPQRPGGTRKNHLISRLGLEKTEDLLRLCEWPRADRRAASALFWTMGAQQVGKAAIHGWKEVLAPGLEDTHLNMALWPFGGTLQELLSPGTIVIAETYPTEFYRHLGFKSGKGDQGVLKTMAEGILSFCERINVRPSSELKLQIMDGFGPSNHRDDRFDAVVGLLGMINVVRGNQPSGDPVNESIRMIEGWIFGQARG